MNIELKPIAESKVRQLGGDVCGVLVRTEDGVMAVSEHGRCTRLDAGVMGPVSNVPASDRDEFEAWFSDNHVRPGETVNLQMKAYMWVGFQAARAHGGQGAEPIEIRLGLGDKLVADIYAEDGSWHGVGFFQPEGGETRGIGVSDGVIDGSPISESRPLALIKSDKPESLLVVIEELQQALKRMGYTHPQPAQQSNQDDVIALLTNALANIRDTDASAKTLQSMAALALRAAKETCDE